MPRPSQSKKTGETVVDEIIAEPTDLEELTRVHKEIESLMERQEKLSKLESETDDESERNILNTTIQNYTDLIDSRLRLEHIILNGIL